MPGIADKFTQSAQGRLLWPGMTLIDLYALLIERQPADLTGAAATVAVRRLIEGAGQFPSLRFIAPLHRCAGGDVVGVTGRADRRRSYPLRIRDPAGGRSRFLAHVEWIEK